MSERVEISNPHTDKDFALSQLRNYKSWSTRRDPLVCAAKRAGASYTEIMTASGLAKGTINTILTKAGLTDPHLVTPEDTMSTLTAPRFFPHHPHFISATKNALSVNYVFRPFTGEEPEPTGPRTLEVSDSDREAMWAEHSERIHEFDAARKLWEKAHSYRTLAPLVQAAINARPPVDQALQAINQAWQALDNALVWQVAVKQLLDAHKKARTVMQNWVRDYALPLAKAQGSQPYYIRDHCMSWDAIARQLGPDPAWDIGYYDSDRYDPYYDSPLDELEETITQQLDELAEIAKYTKP